MHRLLGRHRFAGRVVRARRVEPLPRAPAVQGDRRPVRPRPSPRRWTRWAATSTPSPRRSTPPSTSGCWPSTSNSGLDILSDIMWRPALRAADLDAERQVILDEILMHADEPADEAAEQSSATLFPDHPLGREVLGTESSVEAMTADPHPGLLRRALPSGQHGGRRGRRPRPRPGGRRTGGPRRRSAAGGATPGADGTRRPGRARWPSPGGRPSRPTWCSPPARSTATTRAAYALAVLNHVLGGGLSSRLFQEIRERRGLAYSVWSERVAYDDAGFLSVGLGTGPEHVAEVLDIVTDELAALGSGRDHRAGAGHRQGQPPRRDAPGLRGLRRPHEPDRRRHAPPRRGPDGRRGTGPGGGAHPGGHPRRRPRDLVAAPRTLSVVGPFDGPTSTRGRSRLG